MQAGQNRGHQSEYPFAPLVHVPKFTIFALYSPVIRGTLLAQGTGFPQNRNYSELRRVLTPVYVLKTWHIAPSQSICSPERAD